MDSLIEKWKKTANQRYSDQKIKSDKKNRDPLSSSSDGDQENRNVKIMSASKQSPQQTKNGTIQQQKSVRQSSNANKILNFNSSGKKQHKPPTFTAALDMCTHSMIQILKSNHHQTQMIEQVKLTLVDFAETLQSMGSPGFAFAQVEELQQKILLQEGQIQTLKSSNKDDMSRKLISDLEDKLMESEKQRVKLKAQKDNLQIQIEKISESVGKVQINQEFIQQLKIENHGLRKNNEILIDQISQLHQKDKEQQIIWNQQVEDLVKMLEIVKKQIQFTQ